MFKEESVSTDVYTVLLEEYSNLYTIVKNFILQESVNKLIIFNPKWNDLVNIISSLIQIKEFKKAMVKELRDCRKFKNAREIEQKTLFGFLLSMNMFPSKNDPRIKDFDAAVVKKIESCRTKNAYAKTCKNIIEVYRRNKERIVGIAKLLMKNNVKEELPLSCTDIMIEFFETVLNLNVDRTKMGYMVNKKIIKNCSSNAFGLGVIDLL